MADEADDAGKTVDLFTRMQEQAIRDHAAKPAPEKIRYVFCRNNCGTKTVEGAPYCSEDCEEDHAYRESIRQRTRAR